MVEGIAAQGLNFIVNTVRHQVVLRCRAASLDASARRPYQKR